MLLTLLTTSNNSPTYIHYKYALHQHFNALLYCAQTRSSPCINKHHNPQHTHTHTYTFSLEKVVLLTSLFRGFTRPNQQTIPLLWIPNFPEQIPGTKKNPPRTLLVPQNMAYSSIQPVKEDEFSLNSTHAWYPQCPAKSCCASFPLFPFGSEIKTTLRGGGGCPGGIFRRFSEASTDRRRYAKSGYHQGGSSCHIPSSTVRVCMCECVRELFFLGFVLL